MKSVRRSFVAKSIATCSEWLVGDGIIRSHGFEGSVTGRLRIKKQADTAETCRTIHLFPFGVEFCVQVSKELLAVSYFRREQKVFIVLWCHLW